MAQSERQPPASQAPWRGIRRRRAALFPRPQADCHGGIYARRHLMTMTAAVVAAVAVVAVVSAPAFLG